MMHNFLELLRHGVAHMAGPEYTPIFEQNPNVKSVRPFPHHYIHPHNPLQNFQLGINKEELQALQKAINKEKHTHKIDIILI